MAGMHCGACRGEFASISAFDAHLIRYPDMEKVTSVAQYHGRPVCKGQKNGKPFIDENLTKLRAQAVTRFRKTPSSSGA